MSSCREGAGRWGSLGRPADIWPDVQILRLLGAMAGGWVAPREVRGSPPARDSPKASEAAPSPRVSAQGGERPS